MASVAWTLVCNFIGLVEVHMAGVNLQLLCKVHWSNLSDKFEEPMIAAPDKDELKLHIPSALSDPSTKLRTSVATIMSIMASWDWPEKWPGLVENLTDCLESDDLNLVHGALKTLDMFASGKNLTDVHIPLLVQIVFPQLQRIFGEQLYPERIRMRSIRILYSIITWLGTIKAEYPAHISAAVKPTLPVWFELFQNELSKSDSFGTGHGSKIGVLQVIHQLLAYFPDFIKSALPHLLEPLWTSISAAVEIWERTSVYGNEIDESGYDSDAGDEISFKNYVCMLIEVFTAIDEKKKLQPLLSAGLVDLASVVLRFVQLSDYQASLYTDDPSQFLIEEDEEDPLSFSLRSQAMKLLQCISVSIDCHGIEAVGAAVHKHLQELESLEQEINANTADSAHAAAVYNRRREGILYGVGMVLKAWNEASAYSGMGVADIPFDIPGIVRVLLVDCESNDLILRGRALWCASVAIRMLPESIEIEEEGERPETTNESTLWLVRAATSALQTADAPLPFLIHAATCLTELSGLLDVGTLQETISVALPLLASLAPELEDASLLNLLETLEKWIELDAETTTIHAALVLENVLQSWEANSKDPYLPLLVSSIVSRLASIPEVLPIAQQKVGVVIQQVYSDPASRDNGLVEACTEVLGHLLMHATWPLPDLYSQVIIPQLCFLMLNTVDKAMLHTGCSTLVALVRSCGENLVSLAIESDGIQTNALECVVSTIDRTLNSPELDDHAALFVGPLISKLINTCSAVLGSDRIEAILQSVVLRLQRVELNTLTQELLQIFALLMRENLDLVLSFLAGFTMPGDNAENALSFVLGFWTKTFEDRRGNYQLKVSVLALSSIFGHPALSEIQVPADASIEDALATQEEAIGARTRSKRRANPSAPRSEPLNLRIFRLLIREHMWLLEEKEAPNEMSSDEDEFSIKHSEDQGDLDAPSPFADANDYDFAQDGYAGTISLDRLLQERMHLDDEETDPDILNDPAHSIDLEEFIYEWMKKLATDDVDTFDYCVSQLSSLERNHLIGKLIKSREE